MPICYKRNEQETKPCSSYYCCVIFSVVGSKDCCNKKEDELLNDEEKENRGVKQNVTNEKAVIGRKLIDVGICPFENFIIVDQS